MISVLEFVDFAIYELAGVFRQVILDVSGCDLYSKFFIA